MSIFHNKYDWLGEAEQDVTDAEDAIVRYDDETNDPKDKDIAFFGTLCSIAKSLVEIRDELRKMNERSDDNGST